MDGHCYVIGTTLGDNPVAEQFVALGNYLAEAGHRVVILAPHRRTDLENPRSNPAIYTWPSERPTKLRDARFLSDLIEQYQPSCFVANFAAVNLMTAVGRLKHVPVRIAWYHTISSQIELDSREPKWKSLLLNWRKRLVYRQATHLVANSAASAFDVRCVFKVPKEKCNVFHCSLADPVREFHLKTDLPVPGRLVCVGRLFPSKGQDVLLRALSIVSKKVPSAHVEFVGVGPAQNDYERLARSLGIQNKCQFSGQLKHSEVLNRMGSAVASVVPSRQEAFGLVNIESMAVGTPVIASAVGGIPEIVRDGIDGFLVAPGNPEALAAKLKILLTDSHLRREMRASARHRFLSHFEQRRSTRQLGDWLTGLVKATDR